MIENVSRRAVLKGVASMGGLVIAVKILPVKDAFAQAKKYGAEGMPNGTVNNPQAFVSIAPTASSLLCVIAPRWVRAFALACR